MEEIGEIIADLYYYTRKGVQVAIMALIIASNDDFGPAAFLKFSRDLEWYSWVV